MWRKNQSKDHFFQRAKTDGYRSRAAYKLLEIQEKFRIIKKNSTVLDLGCAPGGWLQILTQMTENFICGLDLQTIEPVKGTHFAQIDCYNTEMVENFLQEVNAPKKFDIILSDMSPNISGDKFTDHIGSINLLRLFMSFCENRLKQDGSAVVKIFDGPKLKDILLELKKRGHLTIFKPFSSRSESSELYIVLHSWSKIKIL